MSKLQDSWSLYYHSFDSDDWSIKGYQKLLTIDTVEEYLTMIDVLSDWTNGMYYLMRGEHLPIWEDPLNNGAGTWTFKFLKSSIGPVWCDYTTHCIGETLLQSGNKTLQYNEVIGISLSPKSTFTTLKVWVQSGKTKSKDFMLDKKKKINFTEARFALNKDR